jgi:apolipoprotein N-acyltransferase
VALLQPNVAQDEKFAAERMPATLAWVAQALTPAQADLVVAPETAVPLLPGHLEGWRPATGRRCASTSAQPGGPAALVGVPLGDYERRLHQFGGRAVGRRRRPYRYDKHPPGAVRRVHPTGFRWFTELMRIPLGDFAAGRWPPSFPVRGERAAPNICYEDLFGEELARRFADAARRPRVGQRQQHRLVRRQHRRPQHLNISRLRSAGVAAADAARHQHRRHRSHRPPRPRAGALPPSPWACSRPVQGRQGLTPFARWAARRRVVAAVGPGGAGPGLAGAPPGRPGGGR